MPRNLARIRVLASGAALCIVVAFTTHAIGESLHPMTIELASLTDAGHQSAAESFYASVDSQGRFVGFLSYAPDMTSESPNLSCGTENRPRACTELYRRDLMGNSTTKVSTTYSGDLADGEVEFFSMSHDGNRFAFISYATNMVPDDRNGIRDAFVRDIGESTTTRVSVSSTGMEQVAVPGSGCQAQCGGVSISGDGRYVVFDSPSPNLVGLPGEPDAGAVDSNNKSDVFIRDTTRGITERASVADDGSEGNDASWKPGFQAVSDDGRWVVFQSVASNLVDGDTNACIPGDGFPSGRSCLDVFVRDREEGRTFILSRSALEVPANEASALPVISGDGSVAAFQSRATNLGPEDQNEFSDIYVVEMATMTIERVTNAGHGADVDGDSIVPHLSRDGRFVAFGSTATNLVPGFTTEHQQVFVFDRETRQTVVASASDDGAVGNDLSAFAQLSPGGDFIAFHSYAGNLVANDENNESDTFLVDLHERGEREGAGSASAPAAGAPGVGIVGAVLLVSLGALAISRQRSRR